MSKNFFYRLNNFLILAIIVFSCVLIYSKFNEVQSQSTSNGSNPIGLTSSPAYIINREIEVNINPGVLDVDFKSDGITGKASKDQKAKFGGDGGLSLISTPLKFTFDKANSNLLLPGEIVYPAIPKGTAPIGYRCKPIPPGANTPKDPNCLYGVTMTSVFTDLETSVVTIGDRQFKVTATNTSIVQNLSDVLISAFKTSGLQEVIATAVGVPDNSRSTVGSIQYWADDQFQQFAKINGDAVSNQTGVTFQTGVNASEGLFASEFSSALESRISTRYKQANIVEAKLEQIGGPAQIYEPFTSKELKTQESGSISFSEALVQLVTQSNQTFTQKQQKLAAQVTLRPIQEADLYGLKYNLCTALEQSGQLQNQKDFENPVKKKSATTVTNPVTGIVTISRESCTYTDVDGTTKDDSGCEMYKKYEASKDKKCITEIAKRSDEKRALTCALSVAKTGSCDDFSVEESDLHMEMIQKAFPIGLGAYFQNATLQNLDTKDTTGPYLNYLSPYFCAKLNLSYDLTGGKDYIYDVSVQTPNVGGKVTNPNSKFVKNNILNQYCVLGGVMSNFAWALNNQTNNFGSNTPSTVINIPKEALTCDKKESAIFGATAVKSNVDGANNLPYYIMDDNIRGNGKGLPKDIDGKPAQDEIALYQGYNAYPLTDIYNDPALRNAVPEKYGSTLDLQVVTDPITKSPKYIVGSFITGKDRMAMALCKLPGKTINYASSKSKSICKIIDEGGFVFPSGVGMTTRIVNDANGKTFPIDSIVVVYQKPGKTKAALSALTSVPGDEDKGALPYVYRHIDVLDFNDIASSQLSGQFELPYRHGVDVIQGADANIYISGLTLKDTTIETMSVTKVFFDIADDEATIKSDNSGIEKINRKQNSKQLTGNLCSLAGNYCTLLTNLAFTNKLSITQDPTSKVIYAVIISGGMGVSYPVDPTGNIQAQIPATFAYKNNETSTGNDESYDSISTMKVNASGDLDIFLERSGTYLSVIQRKNLTSSQNQDLNKICITECLPVMQKHFDPHVFQTDCTGYDGAGSCGYPKLGKIEAPIVKSFVYGPSGKILAWYAYKGIDKTLMQSPDLLYSFTGVYSRVTAIAGSDIGPVSDKEYSNFYIPLKGDRQVKVDDKPVSFTGIIATPIRLRNFTSGGLLVGRDLKDVTGTITEVDNYNPEKLNCMRIYANSVSGIDLYFGDTGLERTNLNPAGSASSPVRPISSSTDSNSSSSQNSGEYCEEKWCIPDEVSFVNNPQYKLVEGSTEFNNTVNKIVDYIVGGRANRVSRRAEYVKNVSYMCKKSSERGIPCAFLAAIWMQESSGSIDASTAFGCFNGTTSFNDQVDCATTTIFNRANEYNGQNVLTGPNSTQTPMASSTKPSQGSCTTSTRFSQAMQRYTPIDKRINIDNQCNKGLVLRTDQDQLPSDESTGKFVSCISDYKPSNAVNNKDYTVAWPKGDLTGSRINLQKALIALAPELQADNNLCYPNKNQTPENTTSNPDINVVIADYDTGTYTKEKGTFYMNLKNWGNDAAAGNVYMALKEDWDSSKPGAQNLSGAHIIKPGQSWSFNDQLNNLQEQYLHKKDAQGNDLINLDAFEQKYSQIVAPWDGRKFDFSGPSVTGGGWCELATTIRMSAEKVVGADGKKLSEQTFSGISEAPPPASDRSYGTSKGWKGDISHWSHSGVTAESFNLKLAVGKYQLDDATKFVSIWLRPSKTEGINDGDLVITNPYGDGSDIDMIVTVQLNEKTGLLTVETFFGKKRINTETGPR